MQTGRSPNCVSLNSVTFSFLAIPIRPSADRCGRQRPRLYKAAGLAARGPSLSHTCCKPMAHCQLRSVSPPGTLPWQQLPRWQHVRAYPLRSERGADGQRIAASDRPLELEEVGDRRHTFKCLATNWLYTWQGPKSLTSISSTLVLICDSLLSEFHLRLQMTAVNSVGNNHKYGYESVCVCFWGWTAIKDTSREQEVKGVPAFVVAITLNGGCEAEGK